MFNTLEIQMKVKELLPKFCNPSKEIIALNVFEYASPKEVLYENLAHNSEAYTKDEAREVCQALLVSMLKSNAIVTKTLKGEHAPGGAVRWDKGILVMTGTLPNKVCETILLTALYDMKLISDTRFKEITKLITKKTKR